MKRKPCKKIKKEEAFNMRASADLAMFKNIPYRTGDFKLIDLLLSMKNKKNLDRKQTEITQKHTQTYHQNLKSKNNNWTDKQNEKQPKKKTYKSNTVKTNNQFQKYFSHNGGFKTNKKYLKKYVYSTHCELDMENKSKLLNIQGIKFDKTSKIEDKRSDLQIEVEHKQQRRVKVFSFQKLKVLKTQNKYSCPSQQKQQKRQFSPNISKHNSTHSVLINSINIQCKKNLPYGKEIYQPTNFPTNDDKRNQILRNFKINTEQKGISKRKRDKAFQSQNFQRTRPYKSQQDLQKSIFITSK